LARPLALLAAAASLAALLTGSVLAPALEPALRGVSRLARAALPWLALSGLPAAGPGREARRRWPTDLALALPALALGAWLDRRAGLGVGSAAALVGIALALVALLGEAGHRAGARPALHAVAWAVLVPAGPLLVASLGRDPAPWLTRASPLGWLWSQARIGAAPATAAELAAPLAAGALLLALTFLPAPDGEGR
jgi:hypothetical protein